MHATSNNLHSLYIRRPVSGSVYHVNMKVGDPEVFTLAEAAERLVVRRTTLVQQVRNGALNVTLSGHIYPVAAEELARYDG